jgi:hypothetical protein
MHIFNGIFSCIDRIIDSRFAAIYGILLTLCSWSILETISGHYGALPFMTFLFLGMMGICLTVGTFMAEIAVGWAWYRARKVAPKLARKRLAHQFYMAHMYAKEIQEGRTTLHTVCTEIRRAYSDVDAKIVTEQVYAYVWALQDGSSLRLVEVRA